MAYYKARNVIEALEMRIAGVITVEDEYKSLMEAERTAKKKVELHSSNSIKDGHFTLDRVDCDWGDDPRIIIRLMPEQLNVARELNIEYRRIRRERQQYEWDNRRQKMTELDLAELKGFLIKAKDMDPDKAINTPRSVYQWLDAKILNKD